MIDDGGAVQGIERNDQGLVQVVCGAPNVTAGLIVAWIPPGATVPTTYDNEPFVLEARELRGIVSNGMLASPSELGINDDHSGILEINESEVAADLVKPGTPFKNLYGLDDTLIDIENKMFTHRPDCFGALGVAREIAGIQGNRFKSPDWYLNIPEFSNASELSLSVDNQLPDLVPRFVAVAMGGVQIKPSPIWMQALLTRVGIKPINNLVDITNYISYLTGQPMHAYDYDKVKSLSDGEASLVVRYPKEGEKVALLNGKTITPRADAIMIATNKELVGVGGIMGGTTTEVDSSTTNIILECANFDMYNIRRTSMTHGLFTDAATRFTKGQSRAQNNVVTAYAMKLVTDMAGGQQASKVFDSETPKGFPYWEEVRVNPSFVNQRLGTNLDAKNIASLLENVEFKVNVSDDAQIEIAAPFWRTDVSIAEDVVEEIGRLLGFDELPAQLPKRSIVPISYDQKISDKDRAREKLASLGANEVLTYSFVHGGLLKRANQDSELAFRIANAISPDLQYYRLSLTPSLLQHVHPNIKAGHEEFAIFEIGKCHNKNEIDEDGVPREFDRISLVLASRSDKSAAYYRAKSYLSHLLGQGFNLVPFSSDLYDNHAHINQMCAPYDPKRSALVLAPKGYVVGIVGEYQMSVLQGFKLPQHTAGFEIFLSSMKAAEDKSYVPLSKYPSTKADITLEVDEAVAFGSLDGAVQDALVELTSEDQYAKCELIDIFASEKIYQKKRYTYHLEVTSYSHSLTDKHVSELLDKVVGEIQKTIHTTKI
jgi:phenylalanyl-tRNA synthetase beta chain